MGAGVDHRAFLAGRGAMGTGRLEDDRGGGFGGGDAAARGLRLEVGAARRAGDDDRGGRGDAGEDGGRAGGLVGVVVVVVSDDLESGEADDAFRPVERPCATARRETRVRESRADGGGRETPTAVAFIVGVFGCGGRAPSARGVGWSSPRHNLKKQKSAQEKISRRKSFGFLPDVSRGERGLRNRRKTTNETCDIV